MRGYGIFFDFDLLTLENLYGVIIALEDSVKVLREFGQSSKQTGRSMLPDMYFLN